MTSSDAVIRTEQLSKTFGRTRALDGLDLTVAPGEVHGFLGPNGAGKTTTLRILLGLLRPSAGSVRVLDLDPWTDPVEVHRRVAYVPGDVVLWPSLSGGEVIDLLARLRGSVDRQRRDALLERFELDPAKRCRDYSKGNRQKVALVAAFAAPVDLMVLDEPTSGLDPLMERVFRELVDEVRRAGRTVLLSSHILSEAEDLCDRVSIIRAGRVVDSAPLAQLRGAHHALVDATLASPADPSAFAALAGVAELEVRGTSVHCRVEPSGLTPLLRLLAEIGTQSLTCTPPSLEDVFLAHYEPELTR
ncbi:ABC transporter ATP-binding protein [Raineyella fluvialis]|uniref:ATP-binding cassette domain-containing protein n=1 Tax=Raineyella fluvialis TaxID=2662261 RepID=A0A5Q2FDV6_9ACTN|nr:ABC transporter ATP-binding protein [Raineyella fluvialis]QGF22456.1 ATP-binding cassette domain-containing protein [Raineyella fluvialis]